MNKITEFELIAKLVAKEPRKAKGLICGVGDDCAVIECGNDKSFLVTTDALVERVHFNTDWTDLKTLGRKSLSVNLSDIAGMGGLPKFYLVAIGLPPNRALDFSLPIYDGMREVAKEYNVIMIGGDTVASPSGIFISITVIGEIDKGKSVLRSGAKSGDAIYVTDTVGGAALGLWCLKKNFREKNSEKFIKSHLNPTPRVSWGSKLAATDMMSSMIDISDGLVADLNHIADESGVGFEIEASKVPTETDFEDIAGAIGRDSLELMLAGGEDYELLFTVKSQRINEFEKILKSSLKEISATKIGMIKNDPKSRFVFGSDGKDLKLGKTGYDHFCSRDAVREI